MSGEKKFLAGNFLQFYRKCSLLVGMNVLGWNWIFRKIIEKFTFGSEPNIFKLCQQSSVSISKFPPTYREEHFQEYFSREKNCVRFFSENEQKRLVFCRLDFRRVVVTGIHLFRVLLRQKNLFLKIYVYSLKKFSFGLWAKVLRILVDKLFLQGCYNCSKRVQNNILRKKLRSGKNG